MSQLSRLRSLVRLCLWDDRFSESEITITPFNIIYHGNHRLSVVSYALENVAFLGSKEDSAIQIPQQYLKGDVFALKMS